MAAIGIPGPPPPAVGHPVIPGAGPIIVPTPTPVPRTFLVRHFPLPAQVDWRLLFPAGRWTGPPEATGPVDADPGRRLITAQKSTNSVLVNGLARGNRCPQSRRQRCSALE